MRRVRYYLGGALFWGAFLAVCVLLFWNAQRLARAAGGISLRYGEALEPRVVASALEYARDGRNNAAWSPTFWAVRQGAASANGREETVRMLRVCGDAELLATEPLLYGALPGPAGQGGCAVSSALAWQLWGALDVTGRELELDGERYTVRGVFESGEARAVTQEAADSRTAEYANVELTAMETAPEGTEAALAFAGASGLGTPAHVVDGPALAGLACALCWLPLALCGACTLWRLARGARRLRPWGARCRPRRKRFPASGCAGGCVRRSICRLRSAASPWARARPAPRDGAARAEPASRRSTASRSGASAAARRGSRRRATGRAASSPSAAVRRGAAACRNTIRRAFRRESRSARRRPRGGSRGRGGRRAANRTPVRGTSVRRPCLRP